MSLMIGAIRQEIRTAPFFAIWVGLLGLLIVVGVVSGGLVLSHGLEITNLTDRVPWGLWITIDLSAIALGAGAFSLSTIAYLFRVKSFQRIARMAVFVGLVGYTSAMLALFMDIGRPDRFWHPVVYWNLHSVLWEITMCVILYASVLLVEFGPILLESKFVSRVWKNAPVWGHRLHRLTPFVAVLGLGLSLLHQSSLGATYGVLVARPLWFKPSMPIMFIMSAVAAGATFTLGLTILYENLIRQRQISTKLRNQVAIFAGLMMAGYLYLKLWDYLATFYYSHLPERSELLTLLERTTPYGASYWCIEIFIGAFVPAAILLTPRLRKQDSWLLVATLLAILGIVVNRWNVTLSGLIVPLDWSPGVANVFGVNSYQPNWVEWGVGVGVIGYALLMFSLGLRYLPMYPPEGDGH
jgi:molybdopterin-containing oxidoreductase family membrane subunit